MEGGFEIVKVFGLWLFYEMIIRDWFYFYWIFFVYVI